MKLSDEGNQLWKMRSKRGSGYFFQTPKILWGGASDYFRWCDEHPFYVEIIRGKTKQPVIKPRAYTLEGLGLFLGCGTSHFNYFEMQLLARKDKESVEFMRVISLIRQVIYEQKFTGDATDESSSISFSTN